MNVLPQMSNHSIERAERGQLHVGLDQGLDGEVDQIRWITHGQCRRADHGGDQRFAAVTVAVHAQMAPDETAIPGQGMGFDPGVEQDGVAGKAQGGAQERDDRLGHLVQHREVAKLLTGLE